uniref:R.Pab1 family restriction endonuclease n=1 Tax=candidate division WOR-3 bacterium TaxID=2052148 RepID=A0A7C3UYW5_UNCW3
MQAMVYLCIYIEKLVDKDEKSLIGRSANTKEFGEIEITIENKELIKDVVKAFAIASQVHKRDILSILRQVKEKCKLK